VILRSVAPPLKRRRLPRVIGYPAAVRSRRPVCAQHHHHRRARRDHLGQAHRRRLAHLVLQRHRRRRPRPSGTLSDGVSVGWTTFGLKITSTVAEYVPHTRIGWYGTGDQLRAYHTWLLIPRDDGSTYVVMEETDTGPAARHLTQANPGHMHRGHDLWNISLKFACES
jgi:hypothetical protein